MSRARAAVRVLAPDDAGYPANLRACPRPPDPLRHRGELLPCDERAVAIVGTRRPSPDGRRRARRLAAALTREGVTVVSGLALGIDAEAHASALAAGGRTLAVLGHGLGRPVAPRANAGLAVAIERRGALLASFPPGTAPTPDTFRARNAVIAGLACAAVVIEAGPTSGARVLARLAADLGRPVLLARSLLDAEPWARSFAAAHGAVALDDPDEVLRALAPPPPSAGRQLSL